MQRPWLFPKDAGKRRPWPSSQVGAANKKIQEAVVASASATITAMNATFAEPAAIEHETSPAAKPLDNATTASHAEELSATTVVGKDHRRRWLWIFLAVLGASQLYFVRELVAAFALFALAFVAIAAVVITLYMLQKSWELAVARVAALRQPVLQVSPVTHDSKPA
jgi:hypothetical protein